MSTLNDVLQLWLNNREFRDAFKKNPKLALKNEAIELNEDDFKKIQSYVERKEAEEESGETGKGTNSELGKRISK